MKQEYKNYNSEDHEVWNILFERQVANLQDKACAEYLSSLNEMKDVIHANKVPDFREVDEVLKTKNGWSIHVVPGLIPVDEFFKLLSERKFCSSTWLRKKSQLDYLEEPDMFHDTFGHIPLLMNPEYTEFVQKMGEMGVKYAGDEQKIEALQRLYWFTIEFGLIQQNGTKIYGAGILSSFGESNHIYNSKITIEDFDLNAIYNRSFINSEIQQHYFELDQYQTIYQSVDKIEEALQLIK
jgi:phenylalanine-4-hydroxylase